MFHPKTLLAPVDFSSRTEAEAQNAAAIAERFEAQLILLHVIPKFSGLHPVDPSAADAYEKRFSVDVEKGVKQALDALAGRVAPGLDVERVVLSGDPVEKIEEVARARKADLIVMPSSGVGRLWRHLGGSVVSQVLQDVPCPVFTGTHLREVPSNGAAPYKRIACRVDATDSGREMLGWAKDFAAAYDGSITAFSVLSFLDDGGAAPSVPKHMLQEAKDKAREQIQALCKKLGVEADIGSLAGPLDKVVPAFLRERNADLLIAGRRRDQDVLGVFGFHTDILDTVNAAPCPAILL